ncbi:hypothetical protein LINPERHAP2_LOCUS4257 [Linum perenne]
MLRMRRPIFWKLVRLLEREGGLRRTKYMVVDEMLVIFLVTIGHHIKNRTCQLMFHRSRETICRTIHRVLQAVLQLHHLLIAQTVPVPPDCDNPTWKFFTNCLGALDGMLINVRTTTASRPRFRTRKGTTAINVLAVCNQNLQFTYCLAGWEGSTHDSIVLCDALSRTGGFRVPEGNTYSFQFRLNAKFRTVGCCWPKFMSIPFRL